MINPNEILRYMQLNEGVQFTVGHLCRKFDIPVKDCESGLRWLIRKNEIKCNSIGIPTYYYPE